MGIQERAAALRGGTETRYSVDNWISDIVGGGSFSYGGVGYNLGNIPGLRQTFDGVRVTEIAQSLPGYMNALVRCPPAFAAQLIRASVLSGARFRFQSKPWSQGGQKVFGTTALEPLETPWPGATTGELISRMEWHVGLTGNSYVARQAAQGGQPARLRVLRPDWVGVIWGSDSQPDSQYPGFALDGELLGFVYWLGGVGAGKAQILLPDEVAWWSPLPDPMSPGLGMSWLTPAIRDMQLDRAMTDHKILYLQNGATPNLVVKGLPATDPTAFLALVDQLEERHAGAANAFRTLYLSAGADATVVGSDLAKLDTKAVQGASETRISFLSRVPATVLGIAEGLSGSSLNAGNFGQARRLFGDTWVFPTLQDLSAACAPLVDVPRNANLWFDTSGIPLLREDAKDAAEVEQTKASTINQLITAGFKPDSVVAAVQAQDMSLLVHSGLVSVQLVPPGKAKEPGVAVPPPADGGAIP